MKLPDSERVIYEYNPLIEVLCQLRFPTILKITQEPVDFQEAIRDEYPYYEPYKPQLPLDFDKIIQQVNLPIANELGYIFKSEDEKWFLSLAKDFIALRTIEYKRYEDFKNRLEKIITIFQEIYKPSFYSRIGLKYTDLIIRSKLGLEKQEWHELISKNIASELYNPDIKNSIQNITKVLVLENEYGLVNLKHGFVNVSIPDSNKEEIAYLLDADFYTKEKVKTDDSIWQPINSFNKSARQIFRWSITDKLHTAMQPQSINN